MQVAVHKLLAKYPDIGSITTTGMTCCHAWDSRCIVNLRPRLPAPHIACPVAGHSLGGALASLSAYDLAFSEINRVGDSSSAKLIPVTAFTFEAPRVGECNYVRMQDTCYTYSVTDPCLAPGNLAYAEGFKAGADSQLKMLRVVNIPDVVPKVGRGLHGLPRAWCLLDACACVACSQQIVACADAVRRVDMEGRVQPAAALQVPCDAPQGCPGLCQPAGGQVRLSLPPRRRGVSCPPLRAASTHAA